LNQLSQTSLDELRSNNKESQDKAFLDLSAETAKPVVWAYEVWEELVELLGDKDNRRRAIASQILCNLAKSDPEKRMLKDIPQLLAITKDERFVTARHCMQSLWKVGVAGEEQRTALLDGLAARFRECAAEKNCTLIRYDIVESLRKMYDDTGDERVRQKALSLIESEDDLKYRKKYAGVWK
jgi:hypothetical protein